MRIQNGTLLTITNKTIKNGYIDIERGKITALGSLKDAPKSKGEILDAKGGFIMPGMIDAHSHIGISEEGLRWEGEDCNETTDPVTPDMRAQDGFNPFDTAIPKALAAGVTTVGVSPGSTNVIGGQIAAMKLFGKNNDIANMIIKAPAAIKCAMGENPKRNYGNSKEKSPMTRMAIAAILRNTLTKATQYAEKKAKGEDVYDPQLEALLPLLRGEIPAHIHAHRADDIMTAVRICKEFGIRYCLVHATGAFNIVPFLAKENPMTIVGPSLGPSSKPETNGGSFATCGILEKAGMEPAITTDHDVTPLWLLPVFAALCVKEGLSEEAALRSITINGAKALGIEDRVGSLEVGKDADIVIMSAHPFEYTAKVTAVLVDGKKIV